jgi:pimeloyl-ACP methyl ester carboxylesterase
MARGFIGMLLGGALLLGGAIARNRVGRDRIHANVFTSPAMGPERPSDLGLAFETLTIPVADRTLQAWFVPAPQAVASVLLFHGQNDALSSWVAALQRLHHQRISALVFNYSGHGDSTGAPTIERVRADSAAAYAVFRAKAAGGPAYLLGYSFGAAVLLDALRHHAMDADGVILASPFSSVRDVAIADGMPRRLAWLIPNYYNNVRAVASVPCPVLIVQSETDGTFPLSMARQVHAANPAAELSVAPSPRHAEVLASPALVGDRADAYWEAIARFIRTRHGPRRRTPL